jgi:hypothetical protein
VELVAVLVGVAVATGVIVLLRRQVRGGRPRSSSARIDPFTVGEPWRQHAAAALSAQRRFTTIVSAVPEGPTRAELGRIGLRVQTAVDECWEIARRGNQLDDTIASLDGAGLRDQLGSVTDEASRTSLHAQLGTVDRLRDARDQTDQRLGRLRTQLGELVSRAAEVSIGTDPTADLGTAVDDVVIQLRALSEAIDEVNTTGRSRGFEAGGGTATSSPA